MAVHHRNPALVLFGNPRLGRDTLIGKHVQAIIYVHAVDGDRYVHGFGDADIDLRSYATGDVRVGGMHAKTGVEMYGTEDGNVFVRGRDGQRLWAFHDVKR